MTDPSQPRPVVVMKFGGTSVAGNEGRAALSARVREALAGGRDPVVVVSAMGRRGAPYATDTLLDLLQGFEAVPREADLLASTGEIVSCVVVAHRLRADGVAAMAMTGGEAGVVTDGVFGAAAVVGVDPTPLTAALRAGVIPVVAGFQGIGPDGEVTTLGRGGSDTSACAIGVALRADAVEIHTDVDGVMTADPRECAGVRVLDAVVYEELFQMARSGAKVVHAPAVELAMEAGVPVWVRNTYTPAKGTMIASAERLDPAGRRGVATAVTNVDDMVRVRLATAPGGGEVARTAGLTRVFRAMADAGVSLDMFTPCGDSLLFSFEAARSPAVEEALARVGLPYEIETALSMVTLVGAGMHGVPGVMARVAESLSSAGVAVLQVADSYYTISVLVPESCSRAAIAALHSEFGLGSGAGA